MAAGGAVYYSQPCHHGRANIARGVLPKCKVFYTSGIREASSEGCGGEKLCYLPAVIGGKIFYLVDFSCGSGGDDDASAFRLWGGKKCPGNL